MKCNSKEEAQKAHTMRINEEKVKWIISELGVFFNKELCLFLGVSILFSILFIGFQWVIWILIK